jgi:hypothetical protein
VSAIEVMKSPNGAYRVGRRTGLIMKSNQNCELPEEKDTTHLAIREERKCYYIVRLRIEDL